MTPAEHGAGSLLSAESEAMSHLASLVHDSDDAIITKDREAIVRSWNPAAERMYGWTAEETIGQPISLIVPPHRSGEERRILDKILAGDRVDHYETERITKDGRIITISLTVSPIRDGDGDIVAASVIARDITAKHRASELASRLHKVTSSLAKELDPDVVLAVILEQSVAALGADAGAVGMVEGEEVVLAGHDGYTERGIADWDRFPLSADVPMSRAITSGEPIWTTSGEELVRRFPDLADARVMFKSLAVLPMAAGGDAFGAVALSFHEHREFGPEDRAFLVAAIQQAANALERAHSYEAQRIAEQRQRLLGEVGELLSQSLDPDAALVQLAEIAVRYVADWCAIDLLDEDVAIRSVAVAHVDPERVRLARELRTSYPVDPSAERGAPNVIRTGVTELHSEITEEMLAEAAVDDEHLRMMRELGLASAMIVPLRARGRVMGTISFVASDPQRRYDETDVEFAEDLARRAALAIDNARLFSREHEAAVTLQRSLLPQDLPEVEGVDLAALYEPAAPGWEVGGDWYEVATGEDKVSVTIGDVAGRGIKAAAIMGRIRSVLGAYVLDGHPPADAIRRLDRLMGEATEMEMATIFHLDLDLRTHSARYVRAGHPPALLRLPSGEVVQLDGDGTPPLGILPDAGCVEHEVAIPPGSLLLLFTDGLIERRDEDLIVGLARVAEALASAPADAEGALAELAAAFRDELPGDDVAMLAMAVSG
jgi:PAS domain S-box-containing protein